MYPCTDFSVKILVDTTAKLYLWELQKFCSNIQLLQTGVEYHVSWFLLKYNFIPRVILFVLVWFRKFKQIHFNSLKCLWIFCIYVEIFINMANIWCDISHNLSNVTKWHLYNKLGINTHLVPKLFRKVQCGTWTLEMFNLVPQFSKEVQFGPLR